MGGGPLLTELKLLTLDVYCIFLKRYLFVNSVYLFDISFFFPSVTLTDETTLYYFVYSFSVLLLTSVLPPPPRLMRFSSVDAKC